MVGVDVRAEHGVVHVDEGRRVPVEQDFRWVEFRKVLFRKRAELPGVHAHVEVHDSERLEVLEVRRDDDENLALHGRTPTGEIENGETENGNMDVANGMNGGSNGGNK